MNAPTKIDMLTAARLTREGRLDEAMAVIHKSLAVGPSPEGPAPSQSSAEPPRGANTPQFSIAGVLGDLAQRIGRVRPAQGFGQGFGGAQGVEPAQGPDPVQGLGQKLHKHIDELLQPVTGRAPVSVPDGARFENHSFANAAGVRAYKLYVPSGYSGRPVPLVVMLHGCTQSPDDFAAGTRMNELAEQQTFLVAYPEQSRSANPGKCWNWFNTDDQQRDRGEPSLIAGITREIMQAFAVEHGGVYIAGLSAGGAAAAIMGSVYPDIYTAIGVHSGLPHGAASDMGSGFVAMRSGGFPRSRETTGRGVPAIVFHGDGDTTVHPANGRGVISQAKAGADHVATVSSGVSAGGVKYTKTVHADDSGRPMAELWVLHGSGHAWSGGSAAGSFTDPLGPDASREMTRFFFQHRAG